MPVAKSLLALLMAGLLAFLGYFFMFRDNSNRAVSGAEADRFMQGSRNTPRNNDDPNYAEELRQNAALVENTQKMAATLGKDISGINSQLAENQRKYESEMNRLNTQLANMQTALDQAKQGNTEAVSAEAQKLAEAQNKAYQESIANLNQAIQNLQQQNEENRRELEARNHALEERLEQLQQPPEADDATAGGNRRGPVMGQMVIPGVITPYRSGLAATPGVTSGVTNNAATGGSTDYLGGLQQSLGQLSSSFQRGDSRTAAAPATAPVAAATAPAAARPLATPNNPQQRWETVFPVYTLPPNSILSNAMLVTPIIGRVPLPNRGGKVEDPFFFKVEIGANNLAANGHQIPGVAKMIASGYATGIRDQQCVRGYIDSLTFIFIDGRIVNQGKASGEGASSGDVLGYLSDPWGKPCIRGRYINNASSYLWSRGSAAFVEAAAEGLAQGQVNYKQNSDGNFNAVLDGDIWKFVFGRGVSGSAAEFAQYIRNRTADTFDVVYVEQGKPVQIMLNTQIPIDYDANARLVNYYTEPKIRRVYD